MSLILFTYHLPSFSPPFITQLLSYRLPLIFSLFQLLFTYPLSSNSLPFLHLIYLPPFFLFLYLLFIIYPVIFFLFQILFTYCIFLQFLSLSNVIYIYPTPLSLLQIKYILFLGENTAGTDNIKMCQAIPNKNQAISL